MIFNIAIYVILRIFLLKYLYIFFKKSQEKSWKSLRKLKEWRFLKDGASEQNQKCSWDNIYFSKT